MSSTPEREVVLRDDAGGRLGVAVVTGDLPVLRLLRLQPEPGHAAGTVRDALRRAATAAGATVLGAEVAEDDELLAAVARGTRLLGEHLSRPVRAGQALPAGFGWRPFEPDEYGPWSERQQAAYAEDNLERSGGDRRKARERARADHAVLLPDGPATADTALVVLTQDGGRVGHLWLRLHRDPGTAFVFDVEVEAAHRGRGFGHAALDVAETLAARAGDSTIGLHVFGGNDVARRLYRSHGYTLRSATHDLLRPAVPG